MKPQRIARRTMVQRFVAFIERGEAMDACWLWRGRKNACGYGTFQKESKVSSLAHRTAWQIYRGPIPEGMLVCHRCDTPACVNPAHLFIGTQLDNIRDSSSKGRMRGGVGTSNAHNKLTIEQVKEIRLTTGSYTDVGKRFGISRVMVRNIRTRKAWKSVA